MKLFLIMNIISVLSAGEIKIKDLEPGRRGNQYRVWIYFDKKDSTSTASLDQASIKRRIKHNIFKPTKHDYNVKKSYINEIQKIGAKVNNQSRWLNALSITADLEKIKLINDLTYVKKIEPIKRHTKKNIKEVFIESPINRNLDYGPSADQIEQINCHVPHIAGYYGQGVRVLYLDTGYELGHEAYDSLNLIAQYDFINDDQNTSNETDQEILENQDDHGTICLSVMAGYAPGSLIGPAFKSEYLLAKTEIVAEEIYQEVDNYVAAIEWGEALGADIACASLGYYDWYEYSDLDGNTAATSIAVDIASSLGVLCVNSAGNEGDDPWYYVCTPADADSILAVGAVDDEGNIANFSSRGPTYDGRIKPEVCARGVSTYCVRSNTENFYRTASGTSFSAPLAAGAAAVIMSANPNWTNMQVRESMMMTAYRSNTPDNVYGYGILNTWAAINYQFTTDIEHEDDFLLPSPVIINKAYPNPFNPATSITIKSLSSLQIVLVGIYNLNGQLLETLYYDDLKEGTFDLVWNADSYSSGIYILGVFWPNGKNSQKITLIK